MRRVDFLGSYPPGGMALGELRGPMREKTEQWLNRISMGLATQHATAAEAHNRLMLTKAFDKSARRGARGGCVSFAFDGEGNGLLQPRGALDGLGAHGPGVRPVRGRGWRR